MKKRVFLFLGVISIITMLFVLPQPGNAACANIGAGNDAHCFGDIEFACLNSNLDWDCHKAISNGGEEQADN